MPGILARWTHKKDLAATPSTPMAMHLNITVANTGATFSLDLPPSTLVYKLRDAVALRVASSQPGGVVVASCVTLSKRDSELKVPHTLLDSGLLDDDFIDAIIAPTRCRDRARGAGAYVPCVCDV